MGRGFGLAINKHTELFAHINFCQRQDGSNFF